MSEHRSSTLALRLKDTGQVFALGREPLTIGRQPDNTIVLRDSSVSRQHARIEWRPEGPVIVDLGSSHGTYVNERRLSGPRLLQPGHVVRVGNTVLMVESVRQPAAAPARGTRGRSPGWLLMAGVALALVAALALLLAAGGALLPDGGEANTALPGNGQGEEESSPTAAPTQAEAATVAPSPAPPTLSNA